MPEHHFQLTPAQKDRLYYLNSMLAYVNHATGCTMLIEKTDNASLLHEYIDGFMLLSAHLTHEVQSVLDNALYIDSTAAHG